jgi:hypothetical protein
VCAGVDGRGGHAAMGLCSQGWVARLLLVVFPTQHHLHTTCTNTSFKQHVGAPALGAPAAAPAPANSTKTHLVKRELVVDGLERHTRGAAPGLEPLQLQLLLQQALWVGVQDTGFAACVWQWSVGGRVRLRNTGAREGRAGDATTCWCRGLCHVLLGKHTDSGAAWENTRPAALARSKSPPPSESAREKRERSGGRRTLLRVRGGDPPPMAAAVLG